MPYHCLEERTLVSGPGDGYRGIDNRTLKNFFWKITTTPVNHHFIWGAFELRVIMLNKFYIKHVPDLLTSFTGVIVRIDKH
ncbi:hypothetical protein [Pseudomonas phage PPAY]|nr:hypothetical protein [Pseudomonas phage PPAY]